MSDRRHSNGSSQRSSTEVEFALLQLGALASDVRSMLLPHEIQQIPSLEAALVALDALFQQRYYDNQDSIPDHGQSPPKRLRSRAR